MTSLDKTAAEPDDTVPDDVEEGREDLATLASTAPVGGTTREHIHNYWQRVRGGDMGSLPAVSGLILLTVIFSLAQPSFHSLFNLGNMFTEGSATIFIAMGLVFVLLLGEIDLAAGYTAGVAAAVMGRLMLGYDLGYATHAKVDADLKGKIPDAMLAACHSCVGIRGTAAHDAVCRHPLSRAQLNEVTDAQLASLAFQVASLDAPALPGGESAGSIGDLIGAEDPGLEHAWTSTRRGSTAPACRPASSGS